MSSNQSAWRENIELGKLLEAERYTFRLFVGSI